MHVLTYLQRIKENTAHMNPYQLVHLCHSDHRWTKELYNYIKKLKKKVKVLKQKQPQTQSQSDD